MRSSLSAFSLLVIASAAPAQVKYPPRPDTYRVDIRYAIRAATDERVRQFRALEANLKAAGFVPDDREDADLDALDPTAERLSGTLPSANAGKLFDDPRVLTAIFRPAGTEPAADPAKLVPVRITIATGLQPDDQRLLHSQVVAQLSRLGFVEGIGYAHYGYALVRGAMPAGRVPGLQKDLRDQPSGWFLPDIPRDQLNLPIRNVLPIRAVEVLPGEVEPPAAAPAEPPPAKVTPDLRNRFADPAAAGAPALVELVMTNPITVGAAELRAQLRSIAPAVTVEGAIGTVAVVRLPSPAELPRVLSLPGVIAARTPRAGVDTSVGGAALPADALAKSNVKGLHAAGYRGAGVRVVVVGTAFPKSDRKHIDLTAELSPKLDPAAGGTAENAALAALLAAAPESSVTLVRVDPTAMHQLVTVARTVLGEPTFSEAIRTRTDEVIAAGASLERRRDIAVEEYRQAFQNLGDDPASAKRRADAQAAYEKISAEVSAFNTLVGRLTALRDGLAALAGADVVVNALVWDEGYAADGLSELSQLLAERFVTPPPTTGIRAAKRPRPPTWVQAVSPAVGSVWGGPLIDSDANGVHEFAGADAKLPAGAWSHELNFLAVRGATEAKDELPAGAKLRIAVQWREAYDATAAVGTEPEYGLTLRLLRQLDPTGTKQATDELVEVARSSTPPVRLFASAGSAVFEQTLEVTTPAAGRYALRLDARPSVVPTFPTRRPPSQLNPRVVVSAEPASVPGRVVFASYAASAAGVGFPADSPGAFVAGFDDGPTGAGPGVALRVKPDVVMPARSSAGAVGFAGGVAALMAQTGARPTDLIRNLGIEPGAKLVLPPEWVQTLSPPR